MREKTGESLSALLDTQADDLDLQRVLNALDGDAEVSRQWRRYNVISAAMRNELGHFAQVDLSARVRESLAQEALPLPLERPARSRAWYRPAASVAVAASVTAAILTGTQLYTAVGGQGVEPTAALAANVPTGPVGPTPPIVPLPYSSVAGPRMTSMLSASSGSVALAWSALTLAASRIRIPFCITDTRGPPCPRMIG